MNLSFLVTAGFYSGEVTKENLAELVMDWIHTVGEDGLVDAIDGHRLIQLRLDDGTTLYRSEGG